MPIILLTITKLAKTFKSGVKWLVRQILPSTFVSSSYQRVDDEQADSESKRLSHAWENNLIPLKQRRIVNRELIKYRSGRANVNFDSVVDAIEVSIRDSVAMANVLEIGCSSGYYSEVFDIAKLNISYTGVDYSHSFIDLARKSYPHHKFDVQNACCLSFPDESFDLVISGCCLLHIAEYEKAIAESVRVASKFVIFHRTPVVWGENTKYYRKTGYGVEMIEIHFNERAFLELLAEHGLRLIKTYVLDSSGTEHVGGALKTYLCEK